MLKRTLRVLVNDIPYHDWHFYALKLLPPLVEDYLKMNSDDRCQITWYNVRRGSTWINVRRLSEWCFKCCLGLLEEGTPTEDTMVSDKRVATLLRFCALYPFSNPKDWFTQTHLDLLVDYHLRICKGSDYHAVEHTFAILGWLRGSPSTQDRKCRYIDTTIRFMGQKETHDSALYAACSVPIALASVDVDNGLLRERFSKALASAIMPHSRADVRPFTLWPNILITYLRLLCALSQDPAWQLHLHHNGHFDNCLVVADTLSTQGGKSHDEYALYVAHILAKIDASGYVHPFYASVQAYPCWPLILRAWKLIFDRTFFERRFDDDWKFAPIKHLEALPSLITFSRKRCQGKHEDLIMLIEQACQKIDGEEQQREGNEVEEIRPSGHQESRALAEKVMVLLSSAQRDV